MEKFLHPETTSETMNAIIPDQEDNVQRSRLELKTSTIQATATGYMIAFKEPRVAEERATKGCVRLGEVAL